MSSVTSPVYSPESSSWSRLEVEHKVGLSTPLQPERQGYQEAAGPRYWSLESPSQMETSASGSAPSLSTWWATADLQHGGYKRIVLS